LTSRRRSPTPPSRGLPREFLTALALIAGAGCSSDDDPLAPAASPVPRLAAFTWQTATPGSQGLDAAKLDALRKGAAGTKILLVVRNDRIVHEWYASGWTAGDKHHTASLAKAVVGGTSLLLALGDGRLSDADAASRHVPDWEGVAGKSDVTIRQLASHTSGLDDADQGDGGWEDDFWNRTPDVFTVAIDRAPLVQPPGSGFRYSNPAIVVLAYAVTSSLRGAAQADILSLLRNRVMNPLGIPGTHWHIGYHDPVSLDGLTLYAAHGGAGLTGRAAASLGRLMLRRGDWEGATVLRPEWVDRALDTSGAPVPDRSVDGAHPRAGFTWFTNGDGVWPDLPADAFVGAGDGHEILLVVPSWNLILVRFGKSLGDPFWESAERLLFTPLADAVAGSTAPPPPPPPPPPNQPPVADFSWTCDDRTCELVDRSTDADGVIVDRSWDLGDGTSSGESTVTHTFGDDGSFTVGLAVTDDDGAQDSLSRSLTVPIVNQPPDAAFDVACSGRRCSFTDRSSDPDGGIASRSWDLGDGATSSAASPVHTYAADGSYTAALTVADEAGLDDRASSEIQVVNAPPTAAFTSSCTNLTCEFTDTSTDVEGAVSERTWDFGDGTADPTAAPSHTYAAAGDHVVTLTVRDGDGAEDAEVRTLTVSAPPVFTLSARGYRVRRKHRVDLTWSGARTAQVDMYRNGARKATFANDGSHTDKMDGKGSATYDYRLCEAGTQVCSNTVRVVF
jgi:PKD repeat protein